MEIGKYLSCKRGFAYRFTNNRGYYKVVEENKLEVIWHENKELIGNVYDVDRIDEDFEEVEESVVFLKFDEEMAAGFKGWATIHNHLSGIRHRIRSIAFDTISSSIGGNTNRNAVKDVLSVLYVPTDDDFEIPRVSTRVVYNSTKDTYRNSIIDYLNGEYNTGYRWQMNFCTRLEQDLDGDVEAMLAAGYTKLDFPEVFKLPYKARCNRVELLRKDNFFICFSTEVKLPTYAGVASIIADELGHPFSEEAIKAIFAEDGDKFIECIYADVDEWVEKSKATRKEKMIKSFEEGFAKLQNGSLEQTRRNIENSIESLQDQLREQFRKKQDVLQKIFYAEHGIASNNEFIEMLKGMSNQPTVKIDGDRVYFCVSSPLTYWDDDLWDIIRRTDNNFKRLSSAQKCLLDEIFLDRTIKLLFETKFWFRKGFVSACRDYSEYNSEFGEGETGIPNPHLHFYDCWGTHKPHIEEALSTNDFTTAYAQSVACMSGITLDDSVVVEKFLRNHLFSDMFANRHCLQMQDGTTMTIKEYLDAHEDAAWEE